MYQILEDMTPEVDARMLLKERNECIAGFARTDGWAEAV